MANWTLKEKSVGELKINIDGDEWKKAVKKAFSKLAKDIHIQGFRPGKAPKAMIEKRLPEQSVYLEALYDNADKWFQDALKELDLIPISRPDLKPGSMNADGCDFTIEMTVRPEAEVGDYKALKYELNIEDVTDEDVNEEIERMRERYADMEVKEDAAAEGDTVNIDYEGFKEGVAFDGGKAEGHDLVLGSGSFIPGFEDQLIGVKAGDEKDIELSFPEDYHAEELAGQPVVFKVKVNEVKTKVLPELDDEFAQDVNYPGVETVDQLKERVRERLTDNKKRSAESAADGELMKQLVDITTVELPDVMVEEEMQNQLNQLASQLQAYGMSLTSYLESSGMTADGLKETFRSEAENNLKTRLALEAVAKAEGFKATAEEIEKEIEDLASMYQMTKEQIKASVDPSMIGLDLTNQRAYDLVRKVAREAAGIVEETAEAEENAEAAE